jgi:hypothetical protein
MDQLVLILTLCGLFLVLLLIMAVTLVLFIKNWTEKRDRYYNEELKNIRTDFAEVKEHIVNLVKRLT